MAVILHDADPDTVVSGWLLLRAAPEDEAEQVDCPAPAFSPASLDPAGLVCGGCRTEDNSSLTSRHAGTT